MSVQHSAHEACGQLAASTLKRLGYQLAELSLLPGASRFAFKAVASSNKGSRTFFLKFSPLQNANIPHDMLKYIKNSYCGPLHIIAPFFTVSCLLDGSPALLEIYKWQAGRLIRRAEDYTAFGAMLSHFHSWAQSDSAVISMATRINRSVLNVGLICCIKDVLDKYHNDVLDKAISESLCFDDMYYNSPKTVVHGDLNLSNILFRKTQCTLTDWDECHCSLHEVDIATMAMNFGSNYGSSLSFQSFIAGYTEAGRQVCIQKIKTCILIRHLILISRICTKRDSAINDYQAAHIAYRLINGVDLYMRN